MKQIIAFLSIILGFISCSSEISDSTDKMILEKGQILIRFTTEPLTIQTRSEFDSPEAKPWETEFSQVDLAVFEGSENRNLISSHRFSKEEALSDEIRIGIPEEYIGKDIILCAIANNIKIITTSTYFELLKLGSYRVDAYNGEYEKLITGLIPQNGFEMSGEAVINQPEIGTLTPVTIELERLVNKIAIKTKVADNFKDLYNGSDIMVQSIYAITPTYSSIVKEPNPPSNSFRIEQASVYENGYYNNLFYFFENPSETTFVVECLFDKDGDFTTTEDQEVITFRFKTPVGLISSENRRNVYHRISVTIKALPDNINPGFTINENWSDSIDQDFDFNFQNPV